MKLCSKCIYYSEEPPVQCDMGKWVSLDAIKPKTFNPMMFECLDYEPRVSSSNFGDDTLFDVFSLVIR
jgi:hypothetical protein